MEQNLPAGDRQNLLQLTSVSHQRKEKKRKGRKRGLSVGILLERFDWLGRVVSSDATRLTGLSWDKQLQEQHTEQPKKKHLIQLHFLKIDSHCETFKASRPRTKKKDPKDTKKTTTKAATQRNSGRCRSWAGPALGRDAAAGATPARRGRRGPPSAGGPRRRAPASYSRTPSSAHGC